MVHIIDAAKAFTQFIHNLPETKEGSLKGLRFAVKDVFDIKNLRIQAGNPEYFAQATVAKNTAPAITILQSAGATLIGKTHTDELGGSLFGLNEHYGAPLNFCSPERVPGGSSSGSAAAVAAGLVDFALGADTSGSVRAPASFCGIYGFRPTLNRIPTTGVLPISPYLDTVGIFARNPQIIRQVLEVYHIKNESKMTRVRVLHSLIDSLQMPLKEAFLERLSVIRDIIPDTTPLVLDKEKLMEWSAIIRTIAMYGLWNVHKKWILNSQPTFGQLINDRLKLASTISQEEFKHALKQQEEMKKFMDNLLEPGDVAIFPTVHDIPPLLSTSISELKDFALKTSCHTCISALAGFPEITLPLRNIQGKGAIGMSFLGKSGDDYSLTSFASHIHSLLQH